MDLHKEVFRLIAEHREHHLAPWEAPRSPEAVSSVAIFLGRIRLEWFRESQQQKKDMGL